MKTRIPFAALLCAATLFFTSCQDRMDQETETADAILVWSGEYMVDGCGFEVVISDKKYKPENEDEIGEAFKVEGSVPVLVEFVRLGTQLDRRCGLSTESKAMDAIRVVSVKRK